MERCSSSSSLIFTLHLLLLSLFTCYPTATSQGICDLVYCGQGKCNSTSTVPFFDCICFPGWIKIQIGPLTFPSCLLPNCTTNLQCGNGSPPPPPPPVAFPPLPPNFTDPCNLVWCADGSCRPNGTRHICECNAGADNLVNNTELPCFQACFLGTDCTDLGLLPPPPPPPPNSGSNGSPPPTSSSDSGGNGWRMINSWKNVGVLTFILLAATFI